MSSATSHILLYTPYLGCIFTVCEKVKLKLKTKMPAVFLYHFLKFLPDILDILGHITIFESALDLDKCRLLQFS